MGHRPFSKPVFPKMNRIGNFQARSAWEALEYLDLHWPEARTAHYRQARSLCQAAVDGLIDSELAKSALADAAQRAGLLADGWEVDGVASNTVFITTRPPLADENADDEVTDVDLIGYNHPREIIRDPALAPSRKKQMLAYWASDIHAVAGVPALRCVRGITVSIDEILEALKSLDNEIDPSAMQQAMVGSSRPF